MTTRQETREVIYQRLRDQLDEAIEIYWTIAPVTASYPCVVIKGVSSQTDTSLRDFTGEYAVSYRYILYAFSSKDGGKETEVAEIIETIHTALNDYHAESVIMKARRTGLGPEMYDQQSGREVYGDSASYELWVRV
jgi:hypothetical protein